MENMASQDRQDRNRGKVVFLAAAFIALVAAGCFPAPGAMNAFYVILPYGAAVVACGMSIASALGLTQGRRPEREDGKERHAKRLSMGIHVALASSLICAAGELVYLMLNGLTGGLWAAFFILLVLVAALGIWMARAK